MRRLADLAFGREAVATTLAQGHGQEERAEAEGPALDVRCNSNPPPPPPRRATSCATSRHVAFQDTPPQPGRNPRPQGSRGSGALPGESSRALNGRTLLSLFLTPTAQIRRRRALPAIYMPTRCRPTRRPFTLKPIAASGTNQASPPSSPPTVRRMPSRPTTNNAPTALLWTGVRTSRTP